jgi:hypothetical protein
MAERTLSLRGRKSASLGVGAVEQVRTFYHLDKNRR